MRAWHFIGGAVLLAITVPVVWNMLQGRRDEAAFHEQLRLARAEGIPTSAAEFAATIPTAKPEENAAPFYRKLKGLKIDEKDPFVLGERLVIGHRPSDLAAAKKALTQAQPILKIVDEATKRPKCWFDRDWSLGAAVLLPEYGDMKKAAKVVALRGFVAATSGDYATTISDADRIFKIADDVLSESTPIGALAAQAIDTIGMKMLATSSMARPDRGDLRRALAAHVIALRPRNLKREHRGDLLVVLSIIDLCSTPDGLSKLGVKRSDVSTTTGGLTSFMVDHREAKARIVKAVRCILAAYDLPATSRLKEIHRGESDLFRAMLAYPIAYDINMQFNGDPAIDEEAWHTSWHHQFVALSRALASRPIPKHLVASDLPSPFDGKPTMCDFDGKQLTVTVSGFELDGEPRGLRIPSNKALVRPSP